MTGSSEMTLVDARGAKGLGISSCGWRSWGTDFVRAANAACADICSGRRSGALRPFPVFRVSRLLSDRDNAAAVLRKLFNVLPGQIQMLHEQFARQVAEPFGKRNLFVSLGAEYFQEL
jgi:hypothetical protein